MESKPRTFKETTLLFAGGAGAGLIIFALFGGVWHVNHFWLVMAATTIFCGLLAVVLRQNFHKMLNALMDNAPWI
ncbi:MULTISPECIES: hypothetical protein [unclassified Coleofasciculus]|uniref:hypothetical protein n=1 Tax=unclassified Coleofasciculus TaxID=2692782 RepID=UPI0018808B02|nr:MULTISPECIES: hypothetical protein [unclassified Coleofasciculus]MBE9129467.1 hypothetical protein [Coleofasciculus sp. LEGE 07081]MBE9152098.1 hypothetical protein [Coleofasciculus sp. LEGE 07092]